MMKLKRYLLFLLSLTLLASLLAVPALAEDTQKTTWTWDHPLKQNVI